MLLAFAKSIFFVQFFSFIEQIENTYNSYIKVQIFKKWSIAKIFKIVHFYSIKIKIENIYNGIM